MRKCKIAILGAGMSGLGAAQTFLQNGVTDIIIIEAKQHPGGRIETKTIENSVIDLGAQWLHATGTDLYELALEQKLISKQTSDEGLGIYVRDDGYIFDELLVKKVDFKIGEILTDCEKFVDSVQFPESLGEYLHTKFNEYLTSSNFDIVTKDRYLELFDWHVRFQLIDNSCSDLHQLSAKQWGRYSCTTDCGQSHINLIGGYQALVDVLVSKIPKELFLLNTPIKSVIYNNKKIELTSERDLKIIADYVISTVSLGVIKNNKNLLYLTSELNQAVDNMGFGGIGKVFLLFSYKWWKTEGFQLIWSKRRICDEHIGTWTRHLSGFDLVLNQPNMLVGWVSELGVEEMEHLSEEAVGRHAVHVLRMFLKDDGIPYPTNVYKTSWSSCKWTRGGYSYTTPASDRSESGPAILSKPVYIDNVPRILLAGEAIHESHFSTTHGAYESGQQQALFLVKHTRNLKLDEFYKTE